VPNFPKAWYELSNLVLSDRIEFSREFCLKTLPYSPHIFQLVYEFFFNLEDICIIITKKINEQNYFVELVYSMKNDSTFFRGRPPLSNEKISLINRQFKDILPRDFLAFLKIHNGFAKNADTGIIEAENIYYLTKQMKELIESQKKTIQCDQKVVDPNDLIFFYQSYQKMDFQCFYTRWFPFGEMGNVFYSYSDSSISNYLDKTRWTENLSFPTFLDWLMFYLEVMEFE
jgi:hypothetical protein